jgi:hypothetical protein
VREDAEVTPTRLKGKKYMKAALVIIDEVDFKTFSLQEANQFFRLLGYHYQRGLLCVTSKQGREGLAGDAGGRRTAGRGRTRPSTPCELGGSSDAPGRSEAMAPAALPAPDEP